MIFLSISGLSALADDDFNADLVIYLDNVPEGSSYDIMVNYFYLSEDDLSSKSKRCSS